MMTMEHELLSELSASIASGKTKLEVFAHSVASGVERGQALNAFTNCLGEKALHTAMADAPEGPLSAIPFGVKDNILTRDFPMSAGTEVLRDFNPGLDASLVRRLKELGGVLVGKNNMPELCQSMTCNNPIFGPVLNPVNPQWIAGGSSGGCAAAVAAGSVLFAVGSDTGGSVRIPAALCGCVGFRPSTGRYSTDGFLPVSPTFDAPGLLARCSADVRWLDALIMDAPPTDSAVDLSALRIGVPRIYFYDNIAPAVADRMDSALKALSTAGATLVEESIDGAAELNPQVGFPIAFYEMLRETAVFLARHEAGVSLEQLLDGIKGPVESQALSAQLIDMAVDRSTYVEALMVNLPKYVEMIDAYFDRHKLDAIVVPTTPLPAVDHRPLGEDGELEHNGKRVPAFLSYIRNAEPFSNYGGPCLSLPVTHGIERPVGLELVGRRGEDSRLLDIAVAVESVT